MAVWNCLHLFVGDDGVSHVDPSFATELFAVGFAPPAPPLFVARVADAGALAFAELPTGWQGGWHVSPSRQWVIWLAGEMGYEAGDSTQFALRPGSFILTSDTHGQGHNSWNAGPEPVRLAIVQVP